MFTRRCSSSSDECTLALCGWMAELDKNVLKFTLNWLCVAWDKDFSKQQTTHSAQLVVFTASLQSTHRVYPVCHHRSNHASTYLEVQCRGSWYYGCSMKYIFPELIHHLDSFAYSRLCTNATIFCNFVTQAFRTGVTLKSIQCPWCFNQVTKFSLLSFSFTSWICAFLWIRLTKGQDNQNN